MVVFEFHILLATSYKEESKTDQEVTIKGSLQIVEKDCKLVVTEIEAERNSLFGSTRRQDYYW